MQNSPINRETLQDTIDAMVMYGDPYREALAELNKKWPVSHQEEGRTRKYSDTVPLDRNYFLREAITKTKGKQAHEYWYYFGKCTPKPLQIPVGTEPRQPFMRFDTQEECQEHINSILNLSHVAV